MFSKVASSWVSVALVAVGCGAISGCVSKGDTRVGAKDAEETESGGGSLCARMCARSEEAGCSVELSCEANCVEQAAACPYESTAFLECVLDQDITCTAAGQPHSTGCDEEATELSACLVREVTALCVERDDECEACCVEVYGDGEEDWTSELARCQCDVCEDECASECSSAASLTDTCAECTGACLVDGQCYGGSECQDYVNCSDSCPSSSSGSVPNQEPEPSDVSEPPTVGGDDGPLPSDVLGMAGAPAMEVLAPSPNLGVAVRRMSEVQCALEMRCNFLLTHIAAGDEAYCQAQVEAWNEWLVDLPGNGYTTANVDACAQRLSDMDCDAWHGPDAACEFRGELDEGEPCADGVQCASAWCQAARFSCGVCAPKPTEGDPCSHWSECASDSACRDGECVPMGLEGQACDDESPCYGSFLTCVDGECRDNDRQLDESCGPSAGEPYCDQVTANLACSAEGTCREATIAATGEACPTFGWCEGYGTCVEGVCVAAPVAGQPCSDEVGPICRWPLVCLDGACVDIPEGYECGATAPVESTAGAGGAPASSGAPNAASGTGGAPPTAPSAPSPAPVDAGASPAPAGE